MASQAHTNLDALAFDNINISTVTVPQCNYTCYEHAGEYLVSPEMVIPEGLPAAWEYDPRNTVRIAVWLFAHMHSLSNNFMLLSTYCGNDTNAYLLVRPKNTIWNECIWIEVLPNMIFIGTRNKEPLIVNGGTMPVIPPPIANTSMVPDKGFAWRDRHGLISAVNDTKRFIIDWYNQIKINQHIASLQGNLIRGGTDFSLKLSYNGSTVSGSVNSQCESINALLDRMDGSSPFRAGNQIPVPCTSVYYPSTDILSVPSDNEDNINPPPTKKCRKDNKE